MSETFMLTASDFLLERKITNARIAAARQPANSQQQLQAHMAVMELKRHRRHELVAFADAVLLAEALSAHG